MKTSLIGMFCMAVALPTVGLGGAPSQLADAAQNKDKAAVRSLLKQKADVNAPQADGTTALMWAARTDDLEMADLLLAAGANVKASNSVGATALYQASANGNAAMIGRLLKAGADVNGTFLTTGETALMEASRSGSVEGVKLLLDRGARLNAKDSLRETTAVMWAAAQDHPDVIKLLADSGADVNARSKTEKDKPSSASAPGAALAPVAKSLLRGGVTALVLAAREGALASVKSLLQAKADIDETTADGSSALLVAVQNGHYDIGTFLIESGASVSLSNQKGWSPLYMAIKNRNIETGELPSPPNKAQTLDLIKLLLDRGAEVNSRLAYETETNSGNHPIWLREQGATPFLRASYAGDIEVMKLLLAKGADPNIATVDGTTPLMAVAGVGFQLSFVHRRSQEEDMEALKLLLELAVDVNAATDQGLTALMGAAHMGANDMIQVLVDHGARLDAQTKGTGYGCGRKCAAATPLMYAEGLQTTSQAGIYLPETVALLRKLMTERGIPVPQGDGVVAIGQAVVATGK
jgi:ankyrin repeat protein